MGVRVIRTFLIQEPRLLQQFSTPNKGSLVSAPSITFLLTKPFLPLTVIYSQSGSIEKG